MKGRSGYGIWIVFIFSGIAILNNPHAIPKLKLEYPDNLFYGGTVISISVVALMFKYILYRIDNKDKKTSQEDKNTPNQMENKDKFIKTKEDKTTKL